MRWLLGDGHWLEGRAPWRLTSVAPIDSIVIIGASLMVSMFGKNLATPHAAATALLASEGHNLPVYGWATGGAVLADADRHYLEARAAHPNAMILMHFGGNDVTNTRLYPGGTANFNARLAELLAAAEGDGRFYPASITFRDYNDNTFITPANGSKPYNENILIPWIAANFPHAMAPYGRPKLDFYRRSLQDYEAWLQADNVHLTPTGITQFRSWIVATVAGLLEEVVPAEITERVYTAPSNPTPSPSLSIINFTWPQYDASYQTPYNNLNTEAAPLALASVLDVNGANTGIAFAVTFTGNPAIASTSPPGRGRNGDGRTTGLAAYAGNLLCSNVLRASLFVTSGVTAAMQFSGCVPGERYEIGMVSSRSLATPRTTIITIGDVVSTWNTSEDPPLERKVVVEATAQGTITAVLAAGESTTFAYINGLSIRPAPGQELTPPTTTPAPTDPSTYTWNPVVPTDAGPNGAANAFFRGNVTTNQDGSYRVTTAAGSTNGRAGMTLPAAGTVMTFEFNIRFDDATRIIVRQVNNDDSTGGLPVLDMVRPAAGAVINEPRTITVQGGYTRLHFIGVTATGQYFTINPATRWRLGS